MSNRRFWISLISLAVVLLAGIIVLATVTQQRSQGTEILNNRSVYNAKPSGYKAWFLTLQQAGVQSHVWRMPFRKMDQLPHPATMLLVEPYTAVSNQIVLGKTELHTILQWVEAGNTLVLLDPFKRASTGLLLKELGIAEPQAPASPEKRYPLQVPKRPWLSSYLKGGLETESPARLSTDVSEAVLLRDEYNRPVVKEIAHGKGKVIVGTVPDLASNAFLQDSKLDNYQFLTNLLLQEGKPLYINEYIHGYGVDSDIFSYYAKTPLGKILGQLVFGFIFLLWISALRWRPAQKLGAATSRNYTLEYLKSLASIYFKAQAASLVLAPQLIRIERLLQTRYRTSLKETGRLQTMLPDITPDPLQSLQQAQAIVSQEKKLPPAALLKLSQHLMAIEERLRYGNIHH